MKIKATVFAVLLAAISTVSFADGKYDEKADREPEVKIIPSVSSHTYKLVYVSDLAGQVKVDIIDKNGSTILTDRILNKNGFIRPYNFSNLPEGAYTLKVIDGQNEIKESFTYETAVTKSPISVRTDLESDNKVKLTVIGVQKEKVIVKIIDRFNRVVAEDDIDAVKSFCKVYDFSKIGGTDFTFEVITSDKILKKAI